MPSDDEVSIEELVDQITVDAYGDEGYWSFLQAFDDHITFPLAVTIVGVPARVTKVDFDGDERRGLTATVARDDHTSTISLLGVELDDRETDAKRWLPTDTGSASPDPAGRWCFTRLSHVPPDRRPSRRPR